MARREPKVPRLEPVAPTLAILGRAALRRMNVYLLEDEDGVVVFDAGEKGMAPAIAAAAARMGGITRVVLGHSATGHRGSAPRLAKVAPVLCHPDAVAEAEGSGGRSYWDFSKLPQPVRTLHRLLHRFVWDGGPVTISGTVAAGDRVAGFEVVELAGHAPGQIGLWRASDRVALASDTVYLTTMSGRPADAHVPHEAYNLDAAQAREAIRRLAALRPRIVAVGHL